VLFNPSVELYDKLTHALRNDPEVAQFGFADQDFLASYVKNQVKFFGYEYDALKPMRNCHSAISRERP
jgi:hypothetical protein